MYIKTNLKYLLYEQVIDGEFNRYDILVRYDAVQKYILGDPNAFVMCEKMDDIRVPCSKEKKDARTSNFIQMISQFKQHGYIDTNPLLVGDNLNLLDGSHRVACALYFKTMVTIRIPSTSWIPLYGRSWFVAHGFSIVELKHLDSVFASIFGSQQNINEILATRKKALQRLKDTYDNSNSCFGQGGFYQQFPLLKFPGQRPTVARFDTYKICHAFRSGKRVLDIGCNTGFISLYVAPYVDHVDGIEVNTQLVSVANQAAGILGIDNCTFHNTKFEDFTSPLQYHTIMSLAVHHHIPLSFEQYFKKIDAMLLLGGIFILESGDLTAKDSDFDDKINYMQRQGYSIYSFGNIKDDEIIYRRFITLVKGS